MSKFCCFQGHSTEGDKIILKPKLKLEIEVELKIAHGLILRLELKFKLELEKSLKIIYCSVPHSTENPVFSVNFSSAVKGSFIAGKAKDRGAFFRGQGGSGVRDMAPPLLGNLGAKFSETSFPHFKTYRKIPNISPGTYVFRRPFMRGLFLEGLLFSGAYLRREICVSKSLGLAS